jgi:hypothetical protein
MKTKIAMATNHRSRAYHVKGEISDIVLETIKRDKKKAKPYYTKGQSQ